MNILLDTHIFIWSLENKKKLASPAKEMIFEADTVYVSIISLWEISIKSQLGKLKANMQKMIEAIELSGLITLPLQYDHIMQLDKLPTYHKDPFDRMLLAQALSEPLQFLTADDQLARYSELVRVVKT